MRSIFQLLFFLSLIYLPLEADELFARLRPNSAPELPVNFRTSDSPFLPGRQCGATREGLDHLRISGSGQFSKESLEFFLARLPKEKVVIVDLRGEFHGFANGKDISWKNKKRPSYNYNVGLESGPLETSEKDLLKSLQTGNSMLFKTDQGTVEFLVEKAQTERELAEELGVQYFRLPIADGRKPSDDEVDRFLVFYRTQPKDRWLHFHCAAGEGRTTTLMCMVDMLENPGLPFKTILERQRAIGGLNLEDMEGMAGELAEKKPWAEERILFLKSFYRFTVQNPGLPETWSSWISRDMLKS